MRYKTFGLLNIALMTANNAYPIELMNLVAFRICVFVFDNVSLMDTLYKSSLQCYSVLSTIAQVLRKMSLKILASWFLTSYLSQTFESYQRFKLYTYSVNDLGLKKFLQ